MGIQSFSFWVESLLIVFIVIFSGMKAVSDGKQKYAPVSKLCGGALITIGILMFGKGLWGIMQDFQTISIVESMRSLLLAPMLTILFLPFIYMQAVFLKLDQINLQLKIYLKTRWALRYWTMIQVVLAFGFRIHDLQSFSTSMWRDVHVHSTKGDIKKIIQNVRVSLYSGRDMTMKRWERGLLYASVLMNLALGIWLIPFGAWGIKLKASDVMVFEKSADKKTLNTVHLLATSGAAAIWLHSGMGSGKDFETSSISLHSTNGKTSLISLSNGSGEKLEGDSVLLTLKRENWNRKPEAGSGPGLLVYSKKDGKDDLLLAIPKSYKKKTK